MDGLASLGRVHRDASPWTRRRDTLRHHWSILRYMTRTRLVTSNHGQVLGALWWILEPLCMVMIYVFLLEMILGRSEQFAFFISCAVLPWRWFTTASAGSTSTIVQKSGILKSIKAPLYIFPMAEISYGMIMFLYTLPVFAGLMLWYRTMPTVNLLWFPVILLIQAMYCFAAGMTLSALTVFVRDTRDIWSLVTRMGFYLSPCLYSVDRVPEAYRDLYQWNPFAVLFPAYRTVLMYGQTPDTTLLGRTAIIGLILVVVSLLAFHKMSKRIVNYL